MATKRSGPEKGAEGQPRNWIQPFLLLGIEQWQVHGYELMQKMTVFGLEALDPGSVYRSLRNLEKDGLVESTWDTSKAGPARRVYSVSDAGRAYLDTWASSLRGYQSMLEKFFVLYSGHSLSDDESPVPSSRREGGS